MFVVFLAVLFALPFGSSAQASRAQNTDLVPSFEEGKVIVTVRNDQSTGLSKSATANFEYRHQVVSRMILDLSQIGPASILSVDVPAGRTAGEMVAELKSDPSVVDAELNWIFEGQDVPNDPWFHFDGTPWNVMNADSNYAEATKQSVNKVTIAVCDTGANFNEPDLAGRFRTDIARNFVTEGASAQDDNGHASTITSQIGAIAGNNLKMVGATIHANVDMVPIKVLNSENKGTYEDLLQGLSYVSTISASEPSLRVVNLSLIGYGGGTAMRNALAVLAKENIVVSVAAGNYHANNDVSPSYPGAFSKELPNVLSVGGFASDGSIASYTNYGETTVSFFAPAEGQAINLAGGSSGTFGTSTAAAYTSAMLANIISQHPQFTFWQSRQQIFQTLTSRQDLLGKCRTGGALNANALMLESPELLPTDQITVTKIKWVSANGGTLKITVSSTDPMAILNAIGYDQSIKIKATGSQILKIKNFPVPPAGTVKSITIISSEGDVQEVSFQMMTDGKLRLIGE